jgi:hypothetical protein
MPRKFSCEQKFKTRKQSCETRVGDSHLVIKSNSKLRIVNRQLKSKYHRLTPISTHNLNSYKPHSRHMHRFRENPPMFQSTRLKRFYNALTMGPQKWRRVTFGFCACPACTATPNSRPHALSRTTTLPVGKFRRDCRCSFLSVYSTS